MAVTKVKVSRKVLDWALARSGKSVSDLEPKFKKLGKWISGEEQPTLRQLKSLAKQTATPFGYFFLDRPPTEKLPIPYFRTLENVVPLNVSPELLDTIYAMQRRQDWMREYLIQIGQEPLDFVQSVRTNESPQSIVESMRKTLKVDGGWASNFPSWTEALTFLRESMEKAGIIVVTNGVVGNNTRRPLKVDEFRGFVLVDEYAPLAFVNGADVKAAQMFTLAHELAHICLGSSAAFDLREIRVANDAVEKKCDQAAAEFLVPTVSMRRHWHVAKDKDKPFEYVARKFKVSEIVVARRALDLDLITKQTFLKFYKEYRLRHRSAAGKSTGGKFYVTQQMRIGRTLGTNVILAVRSDKLLYNEAYHLTGLYGKSFERYAESLGFGRV
jgi:Zn-dependent peptidase ImmA (M78 family)